MNLHVCVIGWTGREAAAQAIAAAVDGHADRLTVVYSNATDTEVGGAGDWVKVPDAWFYGRKFRRCLELHTDGVMLQIQADAVCADWPGLVRRCRDVFARRPGLGLWAPEIDGTPWKTSKVALADPDAEGLLPVGQTDGIVWAIDDATVARLRRLDYDTNNLGWGLDWAAIGYCMANNKLVLRDLSLKIDHPPGSGYNKAEAKTQQGDFLDELSDQERLQVRLVKHYIKTHRLRAIMKRFGSSGRAARS